MLEHDAFQPLTCRENGTAFLAVGQKQTNDIFEVANQFIHLAAGEDRISQSSALDHCISSYSLSPALGRPSCRLSAKVASHPAGL